MAPACRPSPPRTRRAAPPRSCRNRRRRRPGGPSAWGSPCPGSPRGSRPAGRAFPRSRSWRRRPRSRAALEAEGETFARGAAGVEVEQLGRRVAHLLGRLARLLPLARAELVQRRFLGADAGVARDQVQLRHRHVERRLVGVFEVQELAGPSPRSMLISPVAPMPWLTCTTGSPTFSSEVPRSARRRR